MKKRPGNYLAKFVYSWFAAAPKKRRVSHRLRAEILEGRAMLVADAFDLNEVMGDQNLQPVYQSSGAPHYAAEDLSLNSQPMLEFTGDLSGAKPAIAVGNPNGTPPVTLSSRVDANVPTSPFAGVVSIRLAVGNSLGTCTGTLLSPTIVVTAAHCVDYTGGLNGQGVTGDGIVDFTPAQVTVIFNNLAVASELAVDLIAVNPDWRGFNNAIGQAPTIHDDVAVLRLAAPAPAGVPIYPINTVVSTTATQLVMAGYGTQGDGINGYIPNSANYFVKLTGQNVASQFLFDDEGLQTRELWVADFDGPTATTNTLNDGLTLGNNVEVTIGPGDSGGPSFRWNDLNANSVINVGELTWWGNNTYFKSTPIFTAPLFGSQFGGVIGTSQLNFLDQFIPNLDVPTPAVPVTFGPGGSFTDTTPTFDWGGVEFAARYDLYVSRVDQNGTVIDDGIIREQNLETLSFTPSVALPVGKYRYMVRAVNVEGDQSAWSTQGEFTIDSGVPNVPSVTGPATTITSNTPTFTWTAQTYATKYDLWVNQIDQNGATIQAQLIREQTLTTTSFTPTTALPGGKFRVWIRALNSANQASAWGVAYDFSIVPSAPSVTGPTTSVTSNTPTFTWTAQANAAKYDLWVRRIDQNGATIQEEIIRDQNLTTTSYTPTNALPGGKFRVWVRGFNSTGQAGGWSTAYDFSIVPSAPTVTGPAITVTSNTPTFAWTAQANAVKYDLWVRRIDQNGTTIQDEIIRQQNLTTTTFTPTTALPDGRFRVWVRGFNSTGQAGGWSTAYNFSIVPVAPTVTGPSTTVTTTTPTITWTAQTNAVRYDLWVRRIDQNGATIQDEIIRQPNLTTTSFTPTTALPLGKYRIWVRGFNSTGDAGAWSSFYDFTIA